jgi:ADP-heptose:LPS heptosyltransferase
LFSFQVGEAAKQLEKFEVDTDQEVVDLGAEFRTFDDTLSAMRHMDLVITCDTAVAHLAGCIGIPTWVLVPNPPEWRWLLEGTTTPWYDSAKVYRQKNPRNWDQVFDSVIEDLNQYVKEN